MEQTSLDAFESIQEELTTKENKVFEAISELGGEATLYDIKSYLNWEVNCISGRITGLRKKKRIADTGKRGLSPSGRGCIIWSIQN